MPKTYSYAPYRKSILIPFWTLQLIFMIAVISLLSLALSVLGTDNNLLGSANLSDNLRIATKIVAAVWISLAALCMILTITEIVLFATDRLRPTFFLISNIIKSTIWIGLFILDVISWSSTGGRTVSIVSIIIDVILLLSFLGPLMYSSGLCHRDRSNRKYSEEAAYAPVEPAHETSFNPQRSPEYGHFVTISRNTPDVENQAGQETGFQSFNGRKIVRPEYAPIPRVYVQHADADGQGVEVGGRRSES
ncbi:hypothetical protein PVAG01_08741 [Phlyctema vagabunda]|uniref:Uncharacterized protein n=1 Tax=Phlyctema vagabunda TaxID=108571 RepID=A0ABR4PAA6_9HELO